MQSIDLLLSFGTGHGGELLRIATIAALAGMGLHLSQRFIPRLRDYIAAQQDNQEGSRRILTLSRVIRYSVNVIIVTVAALSTLSELGISVAPILGAAGVIGIAIGFGAQSLVKDYFTGFFLLLENQIRHGDVVEAGGKSGLVEELTLRYLRLRDYDGNVHFVPNGQITTVVNMSRGHAHAVKNEIVYRFEFPDRPGALMNFLNNMSHNWNISLFHYRNHGADYGRVLIGIQVAAEEKSNFKAFLDQLGYHYWDETENPVYRLFLA